MGLRLAAALALCMLCAGPLAAHAAEAGVQDDEYEDAERALLVVHKAVGLQLKGGLAFPLLVEGRSVNISITLHNAGAGCVPAAGGPCNCEQGPDLGRSGRIPSVPRRPAADIVLTDVLPRNARLVEGSVTGSWPKLSSGSRHTLNYTCALLPASSELVTCSP